MRLVRTINAMVLMLNIAAVQADENIEWVQIKNTALGKCLSVNNMNIIHLDSCDDVDNQVWFQLEEDLLVRSSTEPNKCIGSSPSGQFLILDDCTATSGWEAYDDNTIRLPSNDGNCWSANGSVILFGQCSTPPADNQFWEAITIVSTRSVPQGKVDQPQESRHCDWFSIQNQQSSKCATVIGDGDDLDLVTMETCDETEEQIWGQCGNDDFVHSYMVPEKCLVPSGVGSPGMPMVIFQCDAGEVYAEWTLHDDGAVRSNGNPANCLQDEDGQLKIDVCAPPNSNDYPEPHQKWTTPTYNNTES